MNPTNPKVDFCFIKTKKWKEKLELLRSIVLDCQPIEGLKWSCPCYMFQKSNLVLLHDFKEYCALLFVKGVFLNDAKGNTTFIFRQPNSLKEEHRELRNALLRSLMEKD